MIFFSDGAPWFQTALERCGLAYATKPSTIDPPSNVSTLR